jgi:DNA-directed RNA polymerase subunit RPC12/RpoP
MGITTNHQWKVKAYIQYLCSSCGSDKGYDKEKLVQPCPNCGSSFVKMAQVHPDKRRTFQQDNRQMGPL